MLARDRSGALHRSWRAAKRAAALARTPDETYRAIQLLACTEYDLGLHREELAHARLLVALQPHNPGSLLILERAADCNNLESLAKQAGAKAAAWEKMPALQRAPEDGADRRLSGRQAAAQAGVRTEFRRERLGGHVARLTG
jgi:hypothetical protein